MATWDLALGTVHEYVPETFQPAEQAPVDDLFADADDNPPENRWVDLLLKPDGTMEFLPQRFFQPTEFLGREWGEGPDLAFEFAPQFGKDLGELFRNGTNECPAVVVDHEQQGVEQGRVHPPSEDLLERLSFALALDAGLSEERLKFVRRSNQLRDVLDLLGDHIERAFCLREAIEAFAVVPNTRFFILVGGHDWGSADR